MAEQSGNTAPREQVLVRPLDPGEIPILLTLIGELADFERMAHRVTATPERMRAALFGPTPFAEAVLGWLGDEPVAYAVYYHTLSTFAAAPGLYIEDILVREAHRGNGYGEILMRHLAGIAVSRGCTGMSWSVLSWNRRAINFYTALGAEHNTEWDAYKISGQALSNLSSKI